MNTHARAKKEAEQASEKFKVMKRKESEAS